MKSIIVYFSFTNNNKKLASLLAKELSINMLEIEEKKKRNSFTFMKDLMSKKTTLLQNDLKALNEYEHVILCAPVWFGKLAKPSIPVIQHLEKMQIPYDLISLRGGEGNDITSIMDSISSWSNHKPDRFLDYHVVDYTREKYKDVTKIKLDDKDLKSITHEISKIYKGEQ